MQKKRPISVFLKIIGFLSVLFLVSVSFSKDPRRTAAAYNSPAEYSFSQQGPTAETLAELQVSNYNLSTGLELRNGSFSGKTTRFLSALSRAYPGRSIIPFYNTRWFMLSNQHFKNLSIRLLTVLRI